MMSATLENPIRSDGCTGPLPSSQRKVIASGRCPEAIATRDCYYRRHFAHETGFDGEHEVADEMCGFHDTTGDGSVAEFQESRDTQTGFLDQHIQLIQV